MAYSKQAQRLQRRIEAIPAQIRREVQPALVRNAQRIADTMKQLAPVDEGDLRDSIAVTKPGDTTPAYSQPGGSRIAGELEAIVTAGNSDVRYAHLQEYGTSEHDAQPFFWPGFRLERPKALRSIKSTISRVIKKWGRAS